MVARRQTETAATTNSNDSRARRPDGSDSKPAGTDAELDTVGEWARCQGAGRSGPDSTMSGAVTRARPCPSIQAWRRSPRLSRYNPGRIMSSLPAVSFASQRVLATLAVAAVLASFFFAL